jgi:hypothetical protein
MFTCLMHFIVIVKTINGALLRPIPTSENFPPHSFFPPLSLSGCLIIFRKISRCAGCQIHTFRFPLKLLYHGSDRSLPRSIFNNFFDCGFLARRAQHFASIVPPPANNTRTSLIYKLTTKLPFIFILYFPFLVT